MKRKAKTGTGGIVILNGGPRVGHHHKPGRQGRPFLLLVSSVLICVHLWTQLKYNKKVVACQEFTGEAHSTAGDELANFLFDLNNGTLDLPP
jgi:hypothetical protein